MKKKTFRKKRGCQNEKKTKLLACVRFEAVCWLFFATTSQNEENRKKTKESELANQDKAIRNNIFFMLIVRKVVRCQRKKQNSLK